MTDENLVFKALADGTRRLMLDALYERSGRSLAELENVVADHVEMSRFGVAKHLKVLETADLVIVHKRGREKLHYLNPVPIRLIHDRWIDKYTQERVAALTVLKDISEKNDD
ncbi:MAG: ArsR/SmtB family transcription factor [Nesterenkonia sp.]